MLLLWLLLITVIYCWKKPQMHLALIGAYGIFLVLNRYYDYLEEKQQQKQQLGRGFQQQAFHHQYMKKKRSVIKLELLLLGMIFIIEFFLK